MKKLLISLCILAILHTLHANNPIKDAFNQRSEEYQTFIDFYSYMESVCYVLSDQSQEYTDEDCKRIAKEKEALEKLYNELLEIIENYEKYLSQPKESYMNLEYLKKRWS